MASPLLQLNRAREPRSGRHRWLVLGTLASALLVITPLVQAIGEHTLDRVLLALRWPLEQRFSPTSLGPHSSIAGFLVPGGSVSRVKEVIRLAHRFPQARIIISGSAERDDAPIHADSDVLARTTFERDAANTYENALFSKAIAAPRPGERWIVVTSALHMPRAIGSFRAVGFPVEPWPVYDAHPSDRYVKPVVLHELAALFAYRIRGHSSAFFPAPDRD